MAENNPQDIIGPGFQPTGAPDFPPSPNVPLVAVAATGAVASLSPILGIGVAGAAGSGAVEALGPAIGAALSGAAGSGIAAPFAGDNLAPAAGAGAVASFGPEIDHALAAAAAAGAVEGFGVVVAVTLAGTAGTGAAGPLVGSGILGSSGSGVAAAFGIVSQIALAPEAATGAAGVLAGSGGLPALAAVPRYTRVWAGAAYIASFRRIGSMELRGLPPIAAGVTQTIALDLAPFLATYGGTVTLEGTPVITCSAYLGDDPEAAARVPGPAQIGMAPAPYGTGVADAAILFQMVNPQAGVIYRFAASFDLSNGDSETAFTYIECAAPQ